MRLHAILFLGLIAGGCKQAASAKQSVQEAALQKEALAMCGQLSHRSGEGCKSDVERNLPRCSAELLAKTITSEGFAKCVGFILAEKPPAPKRLWECSAPLIKATVSVSLAKLSYSENSKMHPIKDRTYFVSNSPLIVSSDLHSARLEDFEGQKMLTFEFSPEAAKRLETTTQDNVGQYLVITLNGVETVAKLASAISVLPLAAPDVASDDVCAPHSQSE
jgi:hypothetical protein